MSPTSPTVPDSLSLIGPMQSIDHLADTAGTIGYEILTGLGPRLKRRYLETRAAGTRP